MTTDRLPWQTCRKCTRFRRSAFSPNVGWCMLAERWRVVSAEDSCPAFEAWTLDTPAGGRKAAETAAE